MIVKFCLISILLATFAQNISTAYINSNNENNNDDSELVLVQIVFRHGDRTPTSVYPKDAYGPAFWNKYGGLGQLSQKGMQQHFAFGLLILSAKI